MNRYLLTVGVIAVALFGWLAWQAFQPRRTPGKHRPGRAPGTPAQQIAAGTLTYTPLYDRDTERIVVDKAALFAARPVSVPEMPSWMSSDAPTELLRVEPLPLVDPALREAA